MNNLPQKYNLISYVKRFFYNLFKRKSNRNESNIEKSIQSEEKDLFTDRLKEDIRKKEVRQNIVEELEKNPEILDSLSLERLEQIDNMYDKIIQENNAELKDLDFRINLYKNTQ